MKRLESNNGKTLNDGKERELEKLLSFNNNYYTQITSVENNKEKLVEQMKEIANIEGSIIKITRQKQQVESQEESEV